MQVEKAQFDALLQKMLKQKPEKTSAIKGKPGSTEPIIAPTDADTKQYDSVVRKLFPKKT